jgi:predicted xylose isomerase-like sugar epimerase
MRADNIREVHMKNQNYILKVTDAKKAEIKKALSDAGIKVRSIAEIYSEDITEEKGRGEDAEKEDKG